jgi:hypothetical protein
VLRSLLNHRPLDALYCASSNAESFHDLENANPFCEVALYLTLYCVWHFGPPKPLSLRLGPDRR